TSPIAAVSVASAYVAVACGAAFFFSWPQAAAQIGFAVFCCMTVLALRPESWWSGLIASGFTVAIGIVVAILSRLASDADIDVLLTESTEQGAMALTERLRETMTLGCSAGVTSWQPGESASLVVSRAHVGLYRAKQAGGNRTVLESSRRPPLVLELADAIAD